MIEYLINHPQIIIYIITSFSTIVATYFFVKYTLADHTKRINKLEEIVDDAIKKYIDGHVMVLSHGDRLQQQELNIRNMTEVLGAKTDSLGVKIERFSEKLSDLGEKVAFVYGSVQALDSVSHGIQKLSEKMENFK